MIDIERMYKYMDLLEGKRFVTASEFMAKMEISHATFKRDLAVLRERFDVPIVYDRDLGVYKLEHACDRKRLPGIWFNSREIQLIRLLEKQIDTLDCRQLGLEIELLRVKLERACKSTITA
jgi:predicted DNA-binding transcriptional regulator YafY